MHCRRASAALPSPSACAVQRPACSASLERFFEATPGGQRDGRRRPARNGVKAAGPGRPCWGRPGGVRARPCGCAAHFTCGTSCSVATSSARAPSSSRRSSLMPSSAGAARLALARRPPPRARRRPQQQRARRRRPSPPPRPRHQQRRRRRPRHQASAPGAGGGDTLGAAATRSSKAGPDFAFFFFLSFLGAGGANQSATDARAHRHRGWPRRCARM